MAPLFPPLSFSPFPVFYIPFSIPFFLPSQLIYDFKDGGSTLGLISLHPESLPEHDKMKFKKIGVIIPSMK